jgi:broad specificity phosphatase PhoE
MKLIIVRHGRTEENEAGILQGHLPGKLTKEGIEQAKKLALRLKAEKIDHIYSSDLARATDTAKEIARHHPKTHLYLVSDLRERNIGVFTGRQKDEIDWASKRNKPTIEGGESLKELLNRAERFLHKILSKHPNDTILLVGHNGINRAIMAAVIGKTWEKMMTIETQKNTSVSIFEIDENRNHTIHLMGCVKHLEKDVTKAKDPMAVLVDLASGKKA